MGLANFLLPFMLRRGASSVLCVRECRLAWPVHTRGNCDRIGRWNFYELLRMDALMGGTLATQQRCCVRQPRPVERQGGGQGECGPMQL